MNWKDKLFYYIIAPLAVGFLYIYGVFCVPTGCTGIAICDWCLTIKVLLLGVSLLNFIFLISLMNEEGDK